MMSKKKTLHFKNIVVEYQDNGRKKPKKSKKYAKRTTKRKTRTCPLCGSQSNKFHTLGSAKRPPCNGFNMSVEEVRVAKQRRLFPPAAGAAAAARAAMSITEE